MGEIRLVCPDGKYIARATIRNGSELTAASAVWAFRRVFRNLSWAERWLTADNSFQVTDSNGNVLGKVKVCDGYLSLRTEKVGYVKRIPNSFVEWVLVLRK